MTDAAGRLLHCRTDGEESAPLLVVAGCSDGVCGAASVVMPDDVEARVRRLLARELPADAIGWAPTRADSLVEALTDVCDLAAPHGGPSYVVPRGLAAPDGIDLRSSDQLDVVGLPSLLPEADRSLTEPWAVAMVDGRVAAVCETARSSPTSVEAGVWTYEPYRRRGLGAAVTAAWSTLVAERTAFYSTAWDNTGSQGVARRLGLRPLGHWWQLSPARVAGTD